MSSSGCWSAPGARRIVQVALAAVLAISSQVGTGLPVATAAPAASGHPNRFDPTSASRSTVHLPQPAPIRNPKPTYSPPRAKAMGPASLVALDPAAGAHWTSADGELELMAPAGAVTAGDVSAAGGLSLLVRQVQPASGSNAGGWGVYRLGTWLVQVVDANGKLAGRGLRQDLQVKLHEGTRAGALDLAHALLVVNPPLPPWADLSPPANTPAPPSTPASGARRATATQSPSPSSSAGPALGPLSRSVATLDASSRTLSAVVPASGPSTAFSFGTNAPEATFGRPEPFETDLSGGGLSAGIPLDLPAGPGGLTPPLTLSYSSASVSDQHNVAAAAPWVGEGWSLGLGSISWAEHNVNSSCPGCPVNWEDSWQLSDPYGTAAELVPPDISVKTYYDDSVNAITPSPVTWHTAPETRARVISFTGPNALPGMSAVPPCFRVFLPSGIMEEFGCTVDALQYYPQPSGANTGLDYVSGWLLDLITDPQGNQIHVTYQRDMVPGAAGIVYPRDAVLGTVEYDSPGCHDAQTACTGTAWAPRVRVNFLAGHSVAHPSGPTCPASGTLRCDDPVDLTASSGLAAPAVQSDFVLNDAQVQVRPSGSGSWNTLRDYRFSYEQGAPTTVTEPVTGAAQSTAGGLLLEGLQELGADGVSALPARTFGYSPVFEVYEDSQEAPAPGVCGPSWNNGITPNGHTGCVMWSQSRFGNSWYLASASNGQGLSESFTWQLARNNFHGVVSGSPADPFACNPTGVQSTYPCNMPDDQSWSRTVLTQRSQTLVRLSQNGQGGSQHNTPVTSTWGYAYQVRYPLPAQECPDCAAGFYWGNQNDNDELDFYNNRFMGFAQTSVGMPDGAVETRKYHTTEGIGIYDTRQPELPCAAPNPCHDDPWWNLDNAAHGHEFELDRYDRDGTTLLEQVRTRWAAACPPPGVVGTPYNPNYGNWDGALVTELDHSNPTAVCEIHPTQADRYTFDGSGGQTAHSATVYGYDGLGRVISQAQVSNTGATAVADASGHGAGAALTGRVTEQVPGLVDGNADTAMSLDGGYASGPAQAALQGGHARSVELWLQTTSRAAQAVFNSGNQGANGQAFAVMLTARNQVGSNPPVNSPGLEVLGWNNDVYVPGLNLTDGQPHHVVVTLNGTAMNVYVDGATPNGLIWNGASWSGLVGQPFTLGLAPNTFGGPVQMGALVAGGTNSVFSGLLDEVAVYDHALTAARVSAHRTAGAGYQAAVLADAPAAYYRLGDGAGGPGPNTIVDRPAYVQNDSVTATATSATGRYLLDRTAFHDLEDTAGNRYQCGYSSFDGQPFALGQSGLLVLGQPTTQDRYTNCGNTGNGFSPSGQLRTTLAYDASGNQVASSDPDANAGVPGHLGCTAAGAARSVCATFDSAFGVQQVSGANALGQATTTGYQAALQPLSAVLDSSGHGLVASWSGGIGFGAPGLTGDGDTAMGFDGATGQVAMNVPGLDTAAGHQVTVELWMRWSGAGSGQMPFGFNGYDLYLLPGAGFGFNTGNGDVLGVPMSAVPANTPIHVVAVFTNGSTGGNRLYLNGVQQTLSQLQGTSVARSASTTPAVSGWSSTPDYRFSGTLDEVAVYNGALSAARVSAHFVAGAGYRASVLADSPLAYHRLDEGTGAASPLGGFGLWPLSRIDANGQRTAITYDALGRETGLSLPGEPAAGTPTMVEDGSGHGLTASWSGGVGFGVPGLVGGDPDAGMSFDGTTSQVGLSLPGLDTAAGHQVTVELWMRWSGTGSGQMPFGFDGYDLYLLPGVGFGFNTGNGDVLGVPMSAVPGNTPIHVVAVFTNGSTGGNRLYLNGVQQTLSQLQGTPLARSASTAAVASGWSSTADYRFSGTLDEVAVYNGALSSTRVSAHFGAGGGYRAAVLADAPLSYHRLDDAGTGTATVATAYTVWCSGTAAQAPCVEVDRTQRLNATTAVTSRAFYDGLGHLVETRTPAPGGQDVVRYAFYDASQRLAFQSVPYLVAAYTGGPGAAAYSLPDETAAGTTITAYDGLGRVLTSRDPLSFQSSKSYAVVCGAAGTGDTTCYEQTLTVDGKSHQGGTLVDGLGRTAYVQRYTGGGPYTLYATAGYSYDFGGRLTTITAPDGITQTTFGYDMAGRKTAMSDPDLGSQTYAYDQDGNLVQSVDARGAAGTIFAGYDGLDRPIWRNTSNSPTGAYDTYTYDSAAVLGVGRLTGETFSAGTLAGSYAYAYDARGRQTSSTLDVGASSYPLGTTYDDADDVLTQSYPDGETITNSYTAQGWLSGVTTTRSGTTTTLASGLAYTGVGGAFGEVTAMHLGGGYDYSATYDVLDRATDLKTKRTSDNAVLFDQTRVFDAAGNVTTASSTMPAGTDNQAFCYDEQDRLTWAGSVGTPPCTGTAISAGTLTAAQYTHAFTYDVMGRLTSGPQGTYAYGSAAHVHAATAIGTTWTAAYDGAGNMTCRAPSSSTTCADTQTGAQLAYNNEGELTNWQNTPSSPTTTDRFLYDGQGQRVAQQVTTGSTTTTTVYVGGVEEVATTGATITTTAFYYAGARRIGLSVNGTVSYLAADGLGSANVTLNASGSATASLLYAPYGGVRYSSGTMPTTYGFTGQRADATSGLDYYGARYYDPLAGQFVSGDGLIAGGGFDLWGLSRYPYVAGNPVNRTDPTGHIHECECGQGGGPPSLPPIGSGPEPNPAPTPIVPCGCNGGQAPYNPPPPPLPATHPTVPQPLPGDSGQNSPPDLGAVVNSLVVSVPPIWYWEHAEALSNTGLDPLEAIYGIGVAGSIGDLKRRVGISSTAMDSDDLSIYILGALLDPDTRQSAVSAISTIVLRPDVQLKGGRGGQNVKNLVGPRNSVVKGSNGRVYLTDDQGRVIADITTQRTKPVTPGRGFGPKRLPTTEELNWITRIWK
jgi:RHS repeat-associated protein